MDWWNRFALWLWRDRYDYDPTIGAPGKDHNVSLWTRWRPARERLFGALFERQLWLAFIAGGFTIGAAFIPYYLEAGKSDQKVQPNAGELLLRCIQEPDHVLRCRPVADGENQVVAGPNSVRLDDKRPAKP